MNKYFTVILIFILFALNINGVTTKIPAELKSEFDKKMAYKREVYNKTLEYIRNNPDSYGLANLYYNVGEMSTEIDVKEPWKTATFYRKVLELNPDFPNKDVVLYNIGFYSYKAQVFKRDKGREKNVDLAMNWPDSLRLSETKLQTSINAFEDIYKNFPDSRYHTEAAYRLGIIYSDIARDARKEKATYYNKAIEYFDYVSRQQGDKLQNYGLFQLAWTYFSSAHFEQAIQDFSKILEIIKADSSKSIKAVFEADAVENVAYSLLEYDGTDFEKASVAAQKAKEIFLNFVDEKYAKEIILKAIDLKLKYNAPMQAIDLYNSYISLYPNNKECPAYVDSIIAIYKRYPSRTRKSRDAKQLIEQQLVRLVENYSPASGWYQKNKDKNIIAELQIIKNAYEFLEPKYYNNFVKSSSEKDFEKYKLLVDNYIKFPEFKNDESLAKKRAIQKRLVDMSLDLAESTQQPEKYFIALENMQKFNSENPTGKDFYIYEDNIFYCYQKIYELIKPLVTKEVYTDTLMNISLDDKGLDSLYVQANLKYEQILESPNYPEKGDKEKRLVKLIYERAEIRYKRNQFDLAFEDYQKLLSHEDVPNDIKKIAFSRLAEIGQNKGDYASAEKYYREAGKYADAKEKINFENNIFASIQSDANSLMSSGDFLSAAEKYLQLSKEIEKTDPAKSTGFKLKAIEAYKKANDYQKAIDLFLDIASRKKTKEEVFTAYASAWAISDSLKDWSQSVKLREQFVDKYPVSKEAYSVRLQVISFYEGKQFNDKIQAAEMYLKLFNDADKMDIGTDKKENIYLKAIAIYQELNMEDKEIELMLDFEKMFPDHPKANEFLQKVAYIYHERGNEAKFEELARYIYRKDPSIDLLTGIAVQNLKKVKSEIDTLFASKQYDLMNEKILEFKHMDKSYEKDNLKLPLESIYEQFKYYKDYISYHQKFADKIAFLENYIKKSPQSLIKVNALTKWKEHLVGGKNRVKNLMVRDNKIKSDVIALIQKGNDYDLSTGDRTKILYLLGKVYDYSADVVEKQVQKFVKVSVQVNNEQIQQNPELQQKTKTALLNAGKKLALDFRREAVKIYQSLLVTFYDDKNYSDKWTELALQRLYELNVRKPMTYEHIYSDATWLVNNRKVNDVFGAVSVDSLWSFVNTIPVTVFDEAKVFDITADPYDRFVYMKFINKYEPESVTINYIANDTIGVFLNGNKINDAAVLKDTVAIDSSIVIPHFSVNTKNALNIGENSLIFSIPADSSDTYFGAHVIIEYDKRKLEPQKNNVDTNTKKSKSN